MLAEIVIADDSGVWIAAPLMLLGIVLVAFAAGAERARSRNFDPEHLTCPACRGRRGSDQLTGDPPGSWKWVECARCHGFGILDAEQAITSGYPIGYVNHEPGEVRFRPYSLFLEPPGPPWVPVYATKDIAP